MNAEQPGHCLSKPKCTNRLGNPKQEFVDMFIFVKSFVLTIIYSVFFFLFYSQLFRGYPSDLKAHINYISSLDEISYPLWHLSVKSISLLFNISTEQSAILFTPLIVVTIFVIIHKILEICLREEVQWLSEKSKQYLFLFISIIVLTASAIYLPFFNKNILLGQSSCGIWHNVTTLMVKPFSFLSILFTILYIETRKIKYFVLGVILTATSAYAKPSYLIVFLPSIFLFAFYFLHKNRGFTKNSLSNTKELVAIFYGYKYLLIYLFIIALVSIIVLINQYMMTFESGSQESSVIVFDYLGVWSIYTPNVVVSLFLTLMFPLLVFMFIDRPKSNIYILSIIMLLVSIMLFAFLAESGARYKHGNFGWSLDIAYHLVFLFSVVEFLRWYQALSIWKKYLLSTTLSLHAVSGLFYLGKILSGGSQF